MDKIYHVLKDLDGRIKSLREESAEHFMDRDTEASSPMLNQARCEGVSSLVGMVVGVSVVVVG